MIFYFYYCRLREELLRENVKPIRILNNDRRVKYFYRYGLTFIASVLLSPNYQSDINMFDFLSSP